MLAVLALLMAEPLSLSIAPVAGGGAGFLPGGGGKRFRTLARKASSPVCAWYRGTRVSAEVADYTRVSAAGKRDGTFWARVFSEETARLGEICVRFLQCQRQLLAVPAKRRLGGGDARAGCNFPAEHGLGNAPI